MTEFDFSGIKNMPKPEHHTEDGLSHTLINALKNGELQIATEGLSGPLLPKSGQMVKGGFSQRGSYIAPHSVRISTSQGQASNGATNSGWASMKPSTNSERKSI